MYKSRRVPFSLFVNIPLTTPRINFRISECHHRFSIDLIVIFSAKNGKLFLDHTDPLSMHASDPCDEEIQNHPRKISYHHNVTPSMIDFLFRHKGSVSRQSRPILSGITLPHPNLCIYQNNMKMTFLPQIPCENT